MKYLVIEIQTFSDGKVSAPAYAFDEKADAEAKYHTLVAGAVKAKTPVFAVVWMTNEGQPIEHKSYTHEVKEG